MNTKTYTVIIKSHCEAPDFEQTIIAKSRTVALAWFVNKYDVDFETIDKNMICEEDYE